MEASMEIILTAWALDSYLELKHKNVFTVREYKATIRPDVLLLKNYPSDPKFQISKFFSFATDGMKNRLADGYKMKWHQVGPGNVQLRAPIGIFSDAYLCEAYVKSDPKKEKRMMAKFKTHLQLIRQNQFTECGRLS
jgi:hypothetical protein